MGCKIQYGGHRAQRHIVCISHCPSHVFTQLCMQPQSVIVVTVNDATASAETSEVDVHACMHGFLKAFMLLDDTA